MERKFAEFVLRFRWPVIVGCILVCCLAASGLRLLTISTEPRDNFGPENPQLLAFEELEATFSRIDNVFFAFSPVTGDVFDNEILKVIEDLTDEAWRTSGVYRVDSLTNYQHTEAEEDDLIVDNLVEFADQLTADELDRIRDIALNEPLILNRLVSADGRVTGVNIDFRFEENDQNAQVAAANWAWDKKAEIMAAHPDIKVYVTGAVIISATFAEVVARDVATQIPLMYLFVVIVLTLLLRSIAGVVGILFATVLTILSAMGMTGWVGIQITPMSSQTPVIILTVVLAHGVHLLVSYYQDLRQGADRYQAMVDAIELNFQPITLTSVSTAIGFLALNVLADVPPIQHIGNITAMGVGFAYVLSLTFVPALVYVLPNRVAPGRDRGAEYMGAFAEFVIDRKLPLMCVSLLTAASLISLAPQNIISDRFSKYFAETQPLRYDTDFTDQNLGGLYRIEYSLDTETPQGISDPGYLQMVDDFADWYRQQEHVSHVNTYTDIVKRLNKNLHGDDPEWYRLPDDKELSAQYLLLYEMSVPFGADLTNQINFDKSSSRFVVSLPSLATPDFIALQIKAQQWLRENAPDFEQEGSSASLMFTHIGIRGMQGSVKGAAIALVLIALVLFLTLRSLRMGVISLVPNLLPGASGFGVWYLLSGEVGQSLSMVLSVTMGIVVDDTVHFLSKYLRARREQGLSSEDAVRYAFRRVGVALTITTVVLIAGFSILAISDFKPNGDTGMMVAIVIGIALILDFILLPPLLMFLDKAPYAKAESALTAQEA